MYLRYGFMKPIIFWIADSLGVQCRRHNQWVIEICTSCFEDANGNAWIFSQASSHHYPSGAAPDDDEIELLNHKVRQ